MCPLSRRTIRPRLPPSPTNRRARLIDAARSTRLVDDSRGQEQSIAMRLRFQITHYAPPRPGRASGPVFSKTELGNLQPNARDRCFATRTAGYFTRSPFARRLHAFPLPKS